ncbi:hypothetical protein [Gloeothece verrucosa]|uniref:Cellulose-binding domain-containing protein n=1 Tax=Gloeothece verrucosa (strain PCC 7822) TaxID=497965 RepID=E0UAN1_GLOV7|nr:hypothetical protein [Gloeothece verrucosa]ADN13883.1 cellulose-binding domain-containing protein [Gloeothece verrucosa PCC 7822]
MFSLKWFRKNLPLILSTAIIICFLYNLLAQNIPKTESFPVASQPKVVEIGTNLTGVTDWSTQLPFIDGFKSSRRWIPQSKKKWNAGEFEQLDLDKNGWVKSLPGANASQEYTFVGTLLYHKQNGHYPGGKYVVLYEGEGKIEYSYDGKKDIAASKPGRDVLNVTPSNAGIWLKITETDPKHKGNYIRNIHVLPQAYEKTYKTEIFNPLFLEKIQPFTTLRFMDWMKTNNSSQKEWSDRPTPDDSTWSPKGVPVEIMVALANRLNVNPWFNMPHQATDDYVKNFATYVRDHLKPGLKVYVEYSNEVWNAQFKQFHWVEEQSPLNIYQTYGKRATQMMNIWDQVFGAKKQQVIGVMGGQTANPWVIGQALKQANDSIDVIAIAPYVGGYIGNSKYEQQVESWTRDPDGGLNKLFQEIFKGGVLTNGPSGGGLPKAWPSVAKLREISQKHHLPLVAYEAGQHLVGVGKVTNNQAITKLFIEANRDPRMREVYEQLITQWNQVLGGTLFMNFSDIGQPSKWGSWGALEYLEQKTSPKYQALLNKIHSSKS